MKLAKSVGPSTSASTRRMKICGVDFDLVDRRHVLQAVCDWRDGGKRGYATFVNPYSVMLCKRDQEMGAAVQGGDLTLPDGVGIVVSANLLSYPNSGRLSGPEMMLFLCDEGRRLGLSHYFYGGAEGVAERLAEQLSAKFPGLSVAGHYTPPFRTLSLEEDAAVVRRINDAKPDVVWVGLGAPKQEKWIAQHAGRIHAAAMFGVGAAFDFHSGNVPWCPAFLRRVGLEWVYRFIQQPGRLWRRYLEVPPYVTALMRQFLADKLMKRSHA